MGTVDKNLGQRVAALRRLAGLTQAGLAERIGVSTETISRIERGVALPGLNRVEEIAATLKVPVSDLFNFHGRASPKDQAIERLISIASRGDAKDVEVLAEVAALLLERYSPPR